MRLVLPVLGILALAGCAGMDATACRSASWYDLGFRDGLFNMQPQDGIYGGQCGQIDVAGYTRGWREGKWEADKRRNESVD